MANKDAPIALRPFYQLGDLVGMGATGAYGALSDVTGFGADLFGLDDLAGSLYDVADEHYKKAGQFYDDLSNTYTDEELSFLTEPLPRPQLGIDTNRFNKLVPEHIRNELSGRGPFDSPHSRAVSASKRAEAESDDYLTVPTGDELDEAQELSDIEKLISFAQGPKDRGALGRQKRQARVDRVIDNKMNADAAAAVAKPAAVKAAEEKTAAEQALMAGMEDFLSGIRGAGPSAPKARSLEDYKKEFAEATGLDISGDVDKSHALMAFGLALMQNKAKGKGIGGMLDALGAAGTAAMPALSEARKEARANAAAAGKYALEMRSADQAKREAAAEKSLQRQAYYVLPRAKNTAEHVANIIDGAGSREFMNAYELNAAVTSPEFSKNYDIIPASQYDAVVAEAMKSPEVDLGDEWDSSIKQVSLIGGKAEDVSPELQVAAFAANPNYKGKTRTNYRLGESKEGVERRFISMQNDINNDAERLGLILKALDDGITIPEQIISSAVQLGRSFGLDMGGVSSVAEAKRQLANIAIDEVMRILNESGRTISDGERKRTEERVGKIDWANADADLVRSQVKDIYNLVVTNGQRNLDNAIASFEENFGVPLAVQGNAPGQPTKAELQQLNARRVAAGKEPLTMDDFK